jgi:hypothetical protein
MKKMIVILIDNVEGASPHNVTKKIKTRNLLEKSKRFLALCGQKISLNR